MNIENYLTYDEFSKNTRWAKKNYERIDFKRISIKRTKNNGILIEADMAVNNYLNHSSIKIYQDGTYDENCDCYYYYGEEPCGHIIALKMKLMELSPLQIPFSYRSFDNPLNENPRIKYERMLEELKIQEEQREKERRKSETDEFLNDIKNSLFKDIVTNNDNIEEIDDGEIYISVEVENHKVSYYRYYYQIEPRLRLKVARNNGHSYAIKNINDFLYYIETDKFFSYGKHLAFEHKLNYFDDASKKIISYIRAEYNRSDKNDHKYISINNIIGFYELFSGLDRKYHPNFECLEEKLHYGLNIDDYDDYIEISGGDISDFAYISKDSFYYFDDDCNLIRVRANMQAISLLKRLMNINSLEINKEDIDEFYNYIIRPSKEYIDFIGYDFKDDKDDISKIEIYADLDDDEALRVSAIYYMNDEKHYSFIDSKKPFECQLIEDCLLKYEPLIEDSIAIISEEEKIGAFIKSAIPFLKNHAEIYISDSLKYYNKPKSMNLSIGVKVDNDLLGLDISGLNISQDDIGGILAAYHKKKRFHRLKNGENIQLNYDELSMLDDTLSELGISEKQLNKDIKLPLYKSLALDSLSKDAKYELKANDAYYQMITKIEAKKIDSYEVPLLYKDILKEYQIFGYRWLRMLKDYGFGGILADDMGLGKTIQVLCLLESIKDNTKYSIVICPTSLVYNWKDEADKFKSELKALCITGNERYRKELIDEVNNYDLIITSYDYIKRDIDLYDKYHFEYVILDEAQYIKNQSTKNAQSVKELNAKYHLALSGTPIENSLAELWSIFDFLMPGYLNNYTHFKKNYETPIVKNDDSEKINKLKKYVEPFILRRRKREVLKELPPRIDKSIYIDFNDEEEKIYQANAIIANRELQEMLNIEGDNYNKIVVLSMLTKLRQLCIEPRLVYDNVIEISSKMKACIELILRLKANRERVLIFSSFKSLLFLLSDELKKNNVSYHILTGDTNKEERKELVDSFQNNNVDAFLISLKAGGTGLNLTSATAVIHFDPWWNLSAQNQASDRAHRIGQTQIVQVFSLIMKNSIEEKIEELQKRKKELSDLFTEGNEGSIASMDKEDLLYLFKRYE